MNESSHRWVRVFGRVLIGAIGGGIIGAALLLPAATTTSMAILAMVMMVLGGGLAWPLGVRLYGMLGRRWFRGIFFVAGVTLIGGVVTWVVYGMGLVGAIVGMSCGVGLWLLLNYAETRPAT